MAIHTYLNQHPDLRVIIFAGLQGQGKSTLASAAAWWLAGRGGRVLLFSSVPRSTAGAVFQLHPGERRSIAGRENLWVQQLCSDVHLDESMQEVRDQYLAQRGQPELSPAVARAWRSLAVSPGLEESLALDTLLDFTANQAYAHVVFDLDLNGQALAVLQGARWLSDQSARAGLQAAGAASGLATELRQVNQRLNHLANLLADADTTAWFIVCQPDEQALNQSVALAERYRELGAPVRGFMLNRVADAALLQQEIPAFERQHIRRQRQLIERLPPSLAGAELSLVPEMQHEGWDARQVAHLAGILFGLDAPQEAKA